MEYRKKCKTCGFVFCYTDDDIKENSKNAALSAINAIGGLASVFGGTIFHTTHFHQQADRYTDKVTDYSRCPRCRSREITALSDALVLEQPDTTTAGQTVQVIKPHIEINHNATPHALIARATLFLEDQEWDSANAYADSCLDLDPHYADAYIIKLMVDLQASGVEDILNKAENLGDNKNYQKALRFADADTEAMLQYWATHIKERIEQEEKEASYNKALALERKAKTQQEFLEAAKLYTGVGQYKDAEIRREQCYQQAEISRKDAIYARGKTKLNLSNATVNDLCVALEAFRQIPDWKDSEELISLCQRKIDFLVAAAEKKAKEEAEKAAAAAEKERRKKKRNRIMIVAAVICCILGTAAFFLLTKVLIPEKNYEYALDLMEDGRYQNAIAAFSALGDFKDAPQKILQCKYAQAEAALANKEYDAAAELFGKIQSYGDAAQRIKQVRYQQAEDALEQGQWQAAAGIFLALGDYEDSQQRCGEIRHQIVRQLIREGKIAEARSELEQLYHMAGYQDIALGIYMELVDSYVQSGNYDQAIAVYSSIPNMNSNGEEYKQLMYQAGMAAMDAKQYESAYRYFSKIVPYLDTKELCQKVNYLRAKQSMQNSEYRSAIALFAALGDYEDSPALLLEAKYGFVMANFDREDSQTYQYLKELKAANYKDSEKKFSQLYAWEVRIVVNYDKNDLTTDYETVNISKNWIYVHVFLSGGEPGAQTELTCKIQYPDKSVSTTKWEEHWKHNYRGYLETFIGNAVFAGKNTIKIYDGQGNLIGEKQIRISK